MSLKSIVLLGAVLGVEASFAAAHPRLFLTEKTLPAVRELVKTGDWAKMLGGLSRACAKQVNAPLPPEPDWLPKGPDRARQYCIDYTTIRPPTHQMQLCALYYALTGDAACGAEAKRRVLYYFGWDPNGPTGTRHNDEPAMSIMRNGCRAYDWTYDLYTSEERAKIESCIVERARAIYEVLNRAKFHVSPANSHLGRQIGFLAEACVAVGAEHPEMQKWLDYVVDIYRTVYPAWAKSDGGWAEGPHYWACYMDFGLDSLTAIRLGTGIDLIGTRDFYRNTPWYFIYQSPPKGPVSPFGDGFQCQGQDTGVIYSFALLLNDPELLWVAQKYRGRPNLGCVRDLVLTAMAKELTAREPKAISQARHFPGVGLVMSHSDLFNPAEDVAFYFRSSPYGAVSHGHCDQNAFVVAGYGEPLAIATGHYNYWGSPHHFKWVRATKAKCAVTIDGGNGQRRHEGLKDAAAHGGKVCDFKIADDIVSFTGDATAAWDGVLSTCRRDVVRVGRDIFLIRDTLAAPEAHTWEYRLHAMDRMALDEANGHVRITRPKATLDVQFLGGEKLGFSQTDQFDPPPTWNRSNGRPFVDQWHFAAATAARTTNHVFYTALRVAKAGDTAPAPTFTLQKGPVDRVTITREGAAPRILSFPQTP